MMINVLQTLRFPIRKEKKTIRVKAGVGNTGETGKGKLDFESIQHDKSFNGHSTETHSTLSTRLHRLLRSSRCPSHV